MKKIGVFKYISTRGLGVECDVDVYREDGKLYTISEMSGKFVSIQWLEENKSVEPVPNTNSW